MGVFEGKALYFVALLVGVGSFQLGGQFSGGCHVVKM